MSWRLATFAPKDYHRNSQGLTSLPAPTPNLFRYKVPGTCLLLPRRTTIGTTGLNFSVRNGKRCFSSVKAPETLYPRFGVGVKNGKRCDPCVKSPELKNYF